MLFAPAQRQILDAGRAGRRQTVSHTSILQAFG